MPEKNSSRGQYLAGEGHLISMQDGQRAETSAGCFCLRRPSRCLLHIQSNLIGMRSPALTRLRCCALQSCHLKQFDLFRSCSWVYHKRLPLHIEPCVHACVCMSAPKLRHGATSHTSSPRVQRPGHQLTRSHVLHRIVTQCRETSLSIVEPNHLRLLKTLSLRFQSRCPQDPSNMAPSKFPASQSSAASQDASQEIEKALEQHKLNVCICASSDSLASSVPPLRLHLPAVSTVLTSWKGQASQAAGEGGHRGRARGTPRGDP